MTAVASSSPRLQARSLCRLAETDAHEGPVYVAAENALYFTTVRTDRVAIKRLALADGTVSVVRSDANMANGMALDCEGRLVVCEQGTRDDPARISRFDPSAGLVETLVVAANGLPLNSPNDVAVRSDGTIWFTDPSYGSLQGFRPLPRTLDRVYRFDPSAWELSVVSESFDKPNGLAFSPDEQVLYVGDSGAIQAPGDYDPARPRRVVALELDGAQVVGERVLVAEVPGFPDGLKVDREGRVYVSCSDGVLVFAGDGRQLGEIRLPGAVNFTFGGRGRDVLFITTDDAVWSASLTAKGA